MDKIRVVHVDDEAAQLKVVSDILSGFNNVEQVGQFSSAKKARDFILDNEVDLAILDIEMKGENGLWLADQIKASGAAIVFLTSHPDYALKAFEACAIHYILKPVTTELVEEILKRYIELRDIQEAGTDNGKQPEKITELVQHYLPANSYPRRIFINNIQKTIVVNLDEVLYMSSKGPYTEFKMADGSRHTSSKMLKIYYETLKNHPDFTRIHRANIVNKNYVKAILRKKHIITALMSDNTELEVSPQKREEIYRLLES